MDRDITLSDNAVPDVTLCSIGETHIERLRKWKNKHRKAFFFRETISPQVQREWFQGYLERSDDYMFVVQFRGMTIGCMGFRYVDGEVDIYNVILGIPAMGKRGIMGQALCMLCNYAHREYRSTISVKVLSDNPAIAWYERNGFKEVATFQSPMDHIRMELEI